MEAKIGKFFDSVGSFFGGGDQIPWCDRDIIAGCEREVADANDGTSEERKSESIMRLSWALVHSRQAEDVNRGIAILEVSLTNAKTPLEQREKLYLLAVGYFRNADYSKSRQLVEQCLEIAPDWRQAFKGIQRMELLASESLQRPWDLSSAELLLPWVAGTETSLLQNFTSSAS